MTSHALRAADLVAVRMHMLLWDAPAVKCGAEGPCGIEHVQGQPSRGPASQVLCSWSVYPTHMQTAASMCAAAKLLSSSLMR